MEKQSETLYAIYSHMGEYYISPIKSELDRIECDENCTDYQTALLQLVELQRVQFSSNSQEHDHGID